MIIGLAAMGNGLCRPSYTIYLSLIASKNHTSQTLALIDVTLNAAMVRAGIRGSLSLHRH